MTQEDQNKLNTSTPPLENNIFFSKLSRFTSSKANPVEPPHASTWGELLEEDWHAKGYRLVSITPVAITTRIAFSDSMCHEWKEEWGVYVLKYTTYTFGIESGNEGPGEKCQCGSTENSTFIGKGKDKGRKMQAKWVVGRHRNINPFFFFFLSHLGQKTVASTISVQSYWK